MENDSNDTNLKNTKRVKRTAKPTPKPKLNHNPKLKELSSDNDSNSNPDPNLELSEIDVNNEPTKITDLAKELELIDNKIISPSTTPINLENIDDQLYEYQIPHVKIITAALEKNNRAIDCSDTGTGKTITTIVAAIKLGLKPFVICPKSVLEPWENNLNRLNCDYYGITNYESLHNCKFYPKKKIFEASSKIRCPFLTRKCVDKVVIKKGKKITKKVYLFEWHVPNDCLIIIDEVHKCKNKRTINAQLLVNLAISSTKILMLSATACECPEKFLIVGLCLGFYTSLKEGKLWIESLSCNSKNLNSKMVEINKLIFPNYGSRMRIKQIKDMFPVNTVIADCIEMDCKEEIEREYKKIEHAVNNLKNKEDSSGCALSRILYARMRIEQLKIPVFKKMILDYLENNCSVAIFVNFTGTLLALSDEFKTKCLIYGEQTLDERNASIHAFKSDKSRIIICNIRSGGVGISLHDEIGDFKKVAIISPSYSAQDVLQTLGRIYRAGSKTETLQKIIYCKDTIEEKLCETIKAKIQNISSMNDGQRDSYIIKNLLEENDEILNTDEISEFDKMYLQINVLNIKKERLQQEIKLIEETILSMQEQIEQHIGYD